MVILPFGTHENGAEASRMVSLYRAAAAVATANDIAAEKRQRGKEAHPDFSARSVPQGACPEKPQGNGSPSLSARPRCPN
jgi:hypothetical protein